MLQLLNEQKLKKIENFINLLINNNFVYKKQYFYSKPNNKIGDILSLITIGSAFSININKLNILEKFIQTLFSFFGEEKLIKIYKYKGNFKNKNANAIYFKDINNYMIKLNQKYLIVNQIEDKIEFTEQEITVLNKDIFKLPVVKQILLQIIEEGNIKKDLFYFLINKSKIIK